MVSNTRSYTVHNSIHCSTVFIATSTSTEHELHLTTIRRVNSLSSVRADHESTTKAQSTRPTSFCHQNQVNGKKITPFTVGKFNSIFSGGRGEGRGGEGREGAVFLPKLTEEEPRVRPHQRTQCIPVTTLGGGTNWYPPLGRTLHIISRENHWHTH